MKVSFHKFFTALSFFIAITLQYSQGETVLENEDFKLSSPDESIKLEITISDFITYKVSLNGKQLLNPSKIQLRINGNYLLGSNPKVIDTDSKEVEEVIKPAIKQKSSTIEDHYNMLKINFENNYSLIFRAYNDGIAYRFVTNLKDSILVNSETIEFNFADDYNIYFPEEESFFTHMERIYIYQKISE